MPDEPLSNSENAFFTANGDALVPEAHAGSAWSDTMLHGRLLGGLLAHALEQAYATPEMCFTRLTVDLFRNARMVPIRVETAEVRTGRRIRVVDATATSEQGVVARASAVLLRRGDLPQGSADRTPAWSAPAPDTLGAPLQRPGWQPPFEVWLLDEAGQQLLDWPVTGKRRAWLQDKHQILPGQPLTPFVRTALAADFASPLSHLGSAGLEFINTDYTLHLSRLPNTPEVGLESTGHISDDGVAVGQCLLHDVHGPIGFCSTSAVSNPTLNGTPSDRETG